MSAPAIALGATRMPPGQALRVVLALIRRGLNELLRVPGAAIPGVLAPTIFVVGLSGVFGAVTRIGGFDTDEYMTFIIAVGMLQGAGFTGAATGVNLARDIEQGWFDRLLLAPVPRSVLLAGVVLSASVRAMIPATFLLTVGLLLGVPFPGVPALLIAAVLLGGFAATAACWGTTIALRFRTQQAAPLIQAGTFATVLFTTAYAPATLLAGWMATITEINPVTRILEGVRQGFVGGVNWADTWQAVAALVLVLLVFGALAVRSLRRADA
jgi:ABC-type multidrug transport system permease subunit